MTLAVNGEPWFAIHNLVVSIFKKLSLNKNCRLLPGCCKKLNGFIMFDE